jgi:hypothetical protein
MYEYIVCLLYLGRKKKENLNLCQNGAKNKLIHRALIPLEKR